MKYGPAHGRTGAYACHDTTMAQSRADLTEVSGYLATHAKATTFDVALECHMSDNHAFRLMRRSPYYHNTECTTRTKLLEHISQYPGQTKRELADFLGIKINTVAWHLRKLVIFGKITIYKPYHPYCVSRIYLKGDEPRSAPEKIPIKHISDKTADKIRVFCETESKGACAREFNVSISTVESIVRGKTHIGIPRGRHMKED